MAARSVDAWRASISGSTTESWSKGTVTVTTTGPYIITCKVTSGGGSLGRQAEVDGETVYCNDTWFVCAPDPIQPSVNPIQSIVGVEGSASPGGGPGINSKEPGGGLRAGMWIDNWYSGGGIISGSYATDYEFETISDFYTALDNGEIVPLNQKVYFDVYIDGTDKPSIFVNWTAAEELGVSLSPRVWIGCESLISLQPEYVTDQTTGLVDTNPAAWNEDPAGSFSYGSSYETTYLSIQQHFEQYLNPISKSQRWGLDGDPEFVKLYLRMVDPAPREGTDGIGQLATVTINKDGTASYIMVEGSSDSPGFNTVVRLHLQEEPDYVLPDDDPDYPGGSNIDDDGPGRYDPDNRPDPDDFTTPNGFDGNAVLTKTYAVSATDLRNIGQKLWSQDYFDVLKIQSNPIENIVSVKAFPFAQTGTQEEVKVGDVAFGVNGDKVPSVWKKKMPNKFKYTGHFNNFLDFSPFTKIKMFLPYIGFIELDPGEIYQSPITVEYFVDLVTGQCMARLYMDENAQGKGIPFQSFYGNMGVDIPLSSTDRVQTEIRAASAAFSAGLGAAGMIVSGNTGGINAALSGATNIAGMDYNTQRSSTQSPTCCTNDCQDVYVMIIRPAADVIQDGERTGYQHLHGYPTNKYLKLSQIGTGNFVQVDRRTDIKISATSEENAMLERLLTEGVYV